MQKIAFSEYFKLCINALITFHTTTAVELRDHQKIKTALFIRNTCEQNIMINLAMFAMEKHKLKDRYKASKPDFYGMVINKVFSAIPS